MQATRRRAALRAALSTARHAQSTRSIGRESQPRVLHSWLRARRLERRASVWHRTNTEAQLTPSTTRVHLFHRTHQCGSRAEARRRKRDVRSYVGPLAARRRSTIACRQRLPNSHCAFFWLLALLVRTAAHLRMGLQEGSGYSAELYYLRAVEIYQWPPRKIGRDTTHFRGNHRFPRGKWALE